MSSTIVSLEMVPAAIVTIAVLFAGVHRSRREAGIVAQALSVEPVRGFSTIVSAPARTFSEGLHAPSGTLIDVASYTNVRLPLAPLADDAQISAWPVPGMRWSVKVTSVTPAVRASVIEASGDALGGHRALWATRDRDDGHPVGDLLRDRDVLSGLELPGDDAVAARRRARRHRDVLVAGGEAEQGSRLDPRPGRLAHLQDRRLRDIDRHLDRAGRCAGVAGLVGRGRGVDVLPVGDLREDDLPVPGTNRRWWFRPACRRRKA